MESLRGVDPSLLVEGRHPEALIIMMKDNERKARGFVKMFVEFELNLLSKGSEIWEFTQEVNLNTFSLSADERELLRCSSVMCW